jgi:hypothetical protein
MKTLINSVIVLYLILIVSFVTKGQEVKNKQTFEQASLNKAKLELVVNKNLADVIIKNHETYYKDYLSISKESVGKEEIQISISSKSSDYEKIIKRLLIASGIKEITFNNKKASLEEFFGF